MQDDGKQKYPVKKFPLGKFKGLPMFGDRNFLYRDRK
jgi:hypothetical protein